MFCQPNKGDEPLRFVTQYCPLLTFAVPLSKCQLVAPCEKSPLASRLLAGLPPVPGLPPVAGVPPVPLPLPPVPGLPPVDGEPPVPTPVPPVPGVPPVATEPPVPVVPPVPAVVTHTMWPPPRSAHAKS